MAIAYYTGRGFAVSYPLTDGTRYDLIVDDSVKLQRVQVKTVGFVGRGGKYEVHLRTCGGNRSCQGTSKYLSEDECELVFVYALNGDLYEFPVKYVVGKASVTLGAVAQSYRVHLTPS